MPDASSSEPGQQPLNPYLRVGGFGSFMSASKHLRSVLNKTANDQGLDICVSNFYLSGSFFSSSW